MNQQVKMIWHEAPGQNITNKVYMLSDFFNKEKIIFRRIKYRFIGSVIDVVNIILFEMHWARHKFGYAKCMKKINTQPA
jgi:hypothetical protein